MPDLFKERIRFPMSLSELGRRHTAVKAAMEKEGIDMLLMSNDNQFLGGYIRYFTDIPAGNAYPMTVMFEKTGEITSICMGIPSQPGPPPWAARVITNRISIPYFRSLNYTHSYDADAIAKLVKDKNIKKLGIVGMGMVSHVIISTIKEKTSAEVVNATPLVDKIKAVKSAEELEFVKMSVKMHEESIGHIKSILKPGMYEYELRAELARWLKVYGSEEQLLILQSQSEKVPHIIPQFYQNRQIQKGDYVTVLNESSGPGGFYAEIMRTFVLGEPSKTAVEAYDTAVELQKWVAEMLRPGVAANSIWPKYNARLREMGMPIEERLFMHGQGYDLVEMPGFGEGDDTILEEGMFIALHPNVYLPGNNEHGVCCEQFLVTPQGGLNMYSLNKQEIVIVE